MPNFLSLLRKQRLWIGTASMWLVHGRSLVIFKELEAPIRLHFGTIVADWGINSTMLPEVDNYLLHLGDIEGEVIV